MVRQSAVAATTLVVPAGDRTFFTTAVPAVEHIDSARTPFLRLRSRRRMGRAIMRTA
ncbi:hypothetical protein [Microtetraspora sp. NBRC 16547]|uniref:hypothetical protein n=1 Tax=Microtetraspora sp. NBRC 16547 TaxID=3030993 RepID=UPI0024A228B6|nr:hypothetical protein [Microtetraspora sp. NBRC 16547]GLX01743.1 hypothetical protein Misp02_58290 [Microtetraspora sp. NBRC 16547]